MIRNIKQRHKRFVVVLGMIVASHSGVGAASHSQQTDKLAQVDQLFARWDNTRSPGCVAFAFRDGEVVMNRAYGMADLEWDQPLTTDTVFYLASTSKQFAAAAIALLVLDGKLTMESTVRDFVPELPDFGPGSGGPIKVKNLVYHTSGLRDYLTLWHLQGKQTSDTGDNQDMLDVLAKQQGLNFETGTRWDYSNTGYVLMSVLVERVSGKSLNDFMQERIYRPLGMNNTHFDDDYQKVVPKRARSYDRGENGEWRRIPKAIGATGDGNMLSTVADLQKWDENFYTHKVGGKAFTDLMQRSGTKPGMVSASKPEIGYAFGLFTGSTYRGLKTIHHGGVFSGFRIQLMRFPDQHFSSGMLCNAGDVDYRKLPLQIADIYLGDQLGPIEEPKKAAHKTPENTKPVYKASGNMLMAYEGTYHSAELGIDMHLMVKHGVLHLSGPRKVKGVLSPTGKHEFSVSDDGQDFATIEFDVTGKGTVEAMALTIQRAENIRFLKMQ